VEVVGSFAGAEDCNSWLWKRVKNSEKTRDYLKKRRDFRAKNVDFHPSQLLVVNEPPAASGAPYAAKHVERAGFPLAHRDEFYC